MTDLEWTNRATFTDRQRGFEAAGPGVYDVPDDAVEGYLDHRSGGWQRPDGDDSDDGDEQEPDGEPADDEHELEDIDGVGSAIAKSLRDEGFETAADVRNAAAESLAAVENVTDGLAESLAGRETDNGDTGDGASR